MIVARPRAIGLDGLRAGRVGGMVGGLGAGRFGCKQRGDDRDCQEELGQGEFGFHAGQLS